MSKTPKRTKAAVLAADHKSECGVVVRELTVGLAMLLEQIGSPVIEGRSPANTSEIMPTIFVMSRPALESQALLARGRAAFDAAVMEFADGLSIAGAAALGVACCQSLGRVSAVSGAGDGGPEKNARSAATAGR